MITINQDIALRAVKLQLNEIFGGLTYALQVYVHGRPVVEIFHPTSDIRQLKSGTNGYLLQALDKMLTSFGRLVSGHATTKSMMVPCSIHSEIVTRVSGEIFAPTNCNTFGCLSCFHRTTSRQNAYPTLISTGRIFAQWNRNERSYFFQVGKVFRVNPQNLYRDPGTPMCTTAYVCIPTTPIRVTSNQLNSSVAV